jgi:hypothetical protein
MWRGFRSVWVALVSLSCFVFDARADPETELMAQISGLPMPPAAGEIVSDWAVGANGSGSIRFSLPDPWAYALPGDLPSDKPTQFAYFRYTNVAGKTLKISSNWAINSRGSGIPDPTAGGADACAHAHHFWGVWAKYNRGGDSYWGFVHYGGKIGRRVDGVCQVSEFDDPLVEYDDSFTWGLASYTWKVDSDATEIIVAAQSQTHGWGTRWGDCGEFACYDQVMVEVMHLP